MGVMKEISRRQSTNLVQAALPFLMVVLALSWRPAQLVAQDDDGHLPLTASEVARQHFWSGVDDAQNIFPLGAARHFEMALEADPGFGVAKVLYAWQAPGLSAADRQAGISEGIGMMAEASATELMLAAAVKEAQAGNGAGAGTTFATLSGLYPDDPRLAMWANTFAGARGDRTDAVLALTDLTTRFPDLAAAQNILAYNQWGRGNRAAAFQAVRAYVELAPDHPNPHDSYAELLQWDGRFEEALAHYARAAELDPEFDQAYLGSAEVYWLMGEPDHAIAQLELAIQHAVTPGAAVAYRGAVGNVYLMQGELDEGLEHLQAAADYGEAEGANNAAAAMHEQMAVADAMLGDGHDVNAHMAKAGELRGASPPIHQLMAAMAHAQMGDAAEAREMTGELMESAPGAFWQRFGHTLMGVADMREDGWKSAMGHLTQADPANPMTQAALAVCLDETGHEVEAEAKWTELTNNRQISLANAFLTMAMMERARH